MLGEAVMELMSKFADQGHSGFSAMLTTDLFSKLSSYKPLTELTNNPDEWQSVMEYYGGPEKDVKGMEFQSRRSPSCFSTDGGKTYYDLDEMQDDEIINSDKKVMHNSAEYTKVAKEGLESSDTKLMKMFDLDRIEILKDKIKSLEMLAKSTPKGQSLSHIYRTMDELEREITDIQNN